MSAGPSPLPSKADGRVQVWREQDQVCAYGYAAAGALSARGYRLWADDAVAFEPGDGGLVAVPLPFQLRLDADSAAALGNGYAAVSTNTSATPLAAAVILRRDRSRAPSIRRLTGG